MFLSQSYLICILLCSIMYIVSCINVADDDDNTNVVGKSKSIKWLTGLQDMIGSPTGHVVVQVAKELLNRSAGNSQVLSLNLTNLLIILLLKVLIFSAGILGAGHWSSYGYGRSKNDEFAFPINNGEAYLITGFLAAQNGFDDCLYRAACEAPNVANEYAKVAKALIDTVSNYEGVNLMNTRYIQLVGLVEKAAHNGYRGTPCNTTTICDNLL